MPYLCLSGDAVSAYDLPDGVDLLEVGELRHHVLDGAAGGNCIKISFPGKSILRDYFQQNTTSQRPFFPVLRFRFPGRPIFIQFIPGVHVEQLVQVLVVAADLQVVVPPHHTLSRVELQFRVWVRAESIPTLENRESIGIMKEM